MTTNKDHTFQPEKLLYSVIYSYDVHPESSVRKYEPPKRYAKRFGLTVWQLTEIWTNGPDEPYSDEPFGWKHRKLCAILTFEEFDAFVNDVGLYVSDVRTMGSLGAPGFGIRWSPAIYWELDPDLSHYDGKYYGDAFGFAYVTPIPATFHEDGQLTPTVELPMDESTWDLIRSQVIDYWN